MQRPVMKSVQSSQIAAIGYDELHADLYVSFNPNKSGVSATYVYRAVPIDVWHAMNVEGISVGTFMNKTIKPNYAFERLADA